MGRPYTEWDEKELRQLEEMKKDGYTVKQISQAIGRGEGAIYHKSRQLGLTKKTALQRIREWGESNNHVHGTNITKNLDGGCGAVKKTISLESHPPIPFPKTLGQIQRRG